MADWWRWRTAQVHGRQRQSIPNRQQKNCYPTNSHLWMTHIEIVSLWWPMKIRLALASKYHLSSLACFFQQHFSVWKNSSKSSITLANSKQMVDKYCPKEGKFCPKYWPGFELGSRSTNHESMTELWYFILSVAQNDCTWCNHLADAIGRGDRKLTGDEHPLSLRSLRIGCSKVVCADAWLSRFSWLFDFTRTLE